MQATNDCVIVVNLVQGAFSSLASLPDWCRVVRSVQGAQEDQAGFWVCFFLLFRSEGPGSRLQKLWREKRLFVHKDKN